MEGEVSMAWSENEKNVYKMGNDREGVGVGGGYNKLSRVFNNLAKRYKQAWESMRTSILPAPVNQITAAGETALGG